VLMKFEGAKRLENAGADLIILEKIPEKISRTITQNVEIPTIGIGAGKYCDGQVLIINDLLGINERSYKHVPKYAKLRETIIDIIKRYQQEIKKGDFPNENHINIIKSDEYNKFENWCMQKKYMV
jgi:3-methyl-2-oxobutanoate hydroxymethyltransferase